MKYTFAFFATLFLFLFTACDSNQAGFSSGDIKVNSHDVHTFSNPAEARATHLNLDLEADFDRKILKGTATWDVTHDGARWVIFDTDNLKISKVEVKAKNKEPQDTDFSLGKTDEMLGRALKVHLDADVNQVIIYYETSPTAEALQWLEPSQTSTSKPFMFSQGQAILTRSWVPIQDSPSNRITYEATIKTPKELMAVMSAENPKQRNESGEYVFKMPQPIPPYLMAIAIGNLRFKAIGDQTGVYAEPGNVDFAAREFAQVDDMMEAAERLYGPYPWGRYDILVLPPSFPFGGMENPKLTFATPTILVGDSSLTSLIAHELAHSWSGNLVTNATWDDFWLNEGITTYIERRIMEEVSGRDYADMLLTLGRQDLQDDLDDLDEVDQHLRLNLKGRNPDDGMTDIAYEKGSLLMQTLEQEVGRDKFDAFLRNYFGTHQFQTITTDQFIAYTKRNLLEPNDSNFDLTAWIDQPGIPSTAIDAPTSKRFAEVDSLRATFIAGQLFPKFTTSSWSTNEWLYFIRGFPVNVDGYRLSQLDKIYKLKDSDNAEIAAAWYELTLRNGYGNEILPEIEAFLIRVGRRKFLTPIYRAMKERGLLAEARSTYAKARPGYHAVTRGTIDELLGV